MWSNNVNSIITDAIRARSILKCYDHRTHITHNKKKSEGRIEQTCNRISPREIAQSDSYYGFKESNKKWTSISFFNKFVSKKNDELLISCCKTELKLIILFLLRFVLVLWLLADAMWFFLGLQSFYSVHWHFAAKWEMM